MGESQGRAERVDMQEKVSHERHMGGEVEDMLPHTQVAVILKCRGSKDGQ